MAGVFGDTSDCCIKDANATDDEECRWFYDTCGVCGGTNISGRCPNPNRDFYMHVCAAVVACILVLHVCFCGWLIWDQQKQQKGGGGGGVKTAKNEE